MRWVWELLYHSLLGVVHVQKRVEDLWQDEGGEG